MFRICRRFIHFIDGYDNRYAGSFRMVNRFNCLGHNAVVRRYDQNGNVCALCASGTHGSKRLMARRIQEGNLLAACIYSISANMLSDTACFTGRYMSLADGIQQGGFAMIDMAHNRNNRRTYDLLLRIIFDFRDLGRIFFRRQRLNIDPEFVTDQRCGVKIDVLVDSYHFS